MPERESAKSGRWTGGAVCAPLSDDRVRALRDCSRGDARRSEPDDRKLIKHSHGKEVERNYGIQGRCPTGRDSSQWRCEARTDSSGDMRQIQLTARRVGWLEDEIEDWIAARVAVRDQSTKGFNYEEA